MTLRQIYVERKFERKSAWLWLYSVTRRKSRRVESFSEEFVRCVVTIYYSSASFFVHMIRQEHLRNTGNIIHMITKRNEQIKE
jgi:ribonucleotide reductase beta subunit family protein with ferritin-like domain